MKRSNFKVAESKVNPTKKKNRLWNATETFSLNDDVSTTSKYLNAVIHSISQFFCFFCEIYIFTQKNHKLTEIIGI